VLQIVGLSIPAIILTLSIVNIGVAWIMLKYLPTNAFRDLISIIFRAFMRLEVEGLENIKKAGPAPIIALNHVSLLDGALALAITEEEPVFAIDTNIAQVWWVKPFLKMCKFLPLDPTKPMATRSLIKVVRDGSPIGIFPEGRLTVTGSLMKVYDGAAMVADKTGAMIVPVRGANVMAGYLRAENPGVLEPLTDGWHDTGDIVTIDEDGFVKIRGRAKRFAKIAGEMVSLAAIEAVAGELWPGALSVVSALPDAKKGERLVLLTEAPGATRAAFLAFAKSKGATELMVPAEVTVGAVPVLGSGKVDFVSARKIAEAKSSLEEAA
jgi:1-acyl-sn-glycerol-3-phosphate acyltransferase